MALYNNEQEALGLSDLNDSEDSVKDCDTDDIIESMPNTPTPNPVLILQHELLDEVMTPVDQPVTPEILRKEEINKSTRVTDDKQVMNQSTSKGKNSQKKKSPANNLSTPAVIEVLTEYEVSSPEETWSAEKITAELKLWGNPIKLSIK
ncbi:hypothetical protein RhiirA5_410541 [Rhizophagus irregularis]|uniref:Uncharacterized protein n=1 Tax=Rhizophagus irregularis TaxID=588596 RepID=A0A2N0Q302_9GLOM|nr:hypothetical protein RhiirA5_410541 [Rhizophagus irregularis]